MRDYKQMIYETFKQTSYTINNELKAYDVTINMSNKHIIDRAIDRDIDITFIRTALNRFENHVCEFLYLTQLEHKQRPWNIELRDSNVIIVIARHNENEWKFKTLLDPAIHSLHADEKTGTFHNNIHLQPK